MFVALWMGVPLLGVSTSKFSVLSNFLLAVVFYDNSRDFLISHLFRFFFYGKFVLFRWLWCLFLYVPILSSIASTTLFFVCNLQQRLVTDDFPIYACCFSRFPESLLFSFPLPLAYAFPLVVGFHWRVSARTVSLDTILNLCTHERPQIFNTDGKVLSNFKLHNI